MVISYKIYSYNLCLQPQNIYFLIAVCIIQHYSLFAYIPLASILPLDLFSAGYMVMPVGGHKWLFVDESFNYSVNWLIKKTAINSVKW